MSTPKRFYYRASDRRLAVVLLLLASICLTLIVFLGKDNKFSKGETDADSATVQPLAPKGHRQEWREKYKQQYYDDEKIKPELFTFDPNQADSTALLRLGLRPWQVRAIYRYRAHGGVFRVKTDFARLHGLTVKQYKELEPYINISSDYQPASTLVAKESNLRDTLKYPIKLKPTEKVFLNGADTTTLKRVPGIGSYYARVIVAYGQRLGGYINIDQLDEIEGFPTEAKKFFEMGSDKPRRMNVNKMTLGELRNHPYMGHWRAKTIVEYRRLHGRINDIDDLSLSEAFNEEARERLRPYIEY